MLVLIINGGELLSSVAFFVMLPLCLPLVLSHTSHGNIIMQTLKEGLFKTSAQWQDESMPSLPHW